MGTKAFLPSAYTHLYFRRWDHSFRKIYSHKGFFLPVKAVASGFRGRYIAGLKGLYDKGLLNLSCKSSLQDQDEWKTFINALFEKLWVPFIKETFNGKGNAIRYLARYSYRTAIANSRVISVDDDTVTFKYKDYADSSREKTMTVKGTDFIGMMLLHVLPSGFHRIRFFGYLNNSQKTKYLKLIHCLRNTLFSGNPYRTMNTAELIMSLYGKDICSCPECSGKLIPYPRGMPTSMLPSLLNDTPFAMC